MIFIAEETSVGTLLGTTHPRSSPYYGQRALFICKSYRRSISLFITDDERWSTVMRGRSRRATGDRRRIEDLDDPVDIEARMADHPVVEEVLPGASRRGLRGVSAGLALLLSACSGGAATAPSAPVTVLHLDAAAPAKVAAPSSGAEDPSGEPDTPRKLVALPACVRALREGVEIQLAKPGAPGEAMYAQALRREKADDLDQARRGYLELVQKEPSSPYIPLAYLAFAEMFFREAEGDPSKLSFAAQAYEEVTKYPAPENPAAAYARYQLAQVRRREGQNEQALAHLKRAVEQALGFADLPCAAQVVARARADLVDVYALIGSPAKARSFFRTVSGDPAGDETRTLVMVAALAEAYVAANRPQEAVDALLAVPSQAAPAAFCRREADLLPALDRAAAQPDQRRKLDALAQTHGARCADPHAP
jgi:TolA-binding protein